MLFSKIDNINLCFILKYSASCSARFWECDNNRTQLKNFNLSSNYHSIIKSFFQNCFSFKTSCVVGHPNEVVVPPGKTVLINNFIAMFYSRNGTFVRATLSEKTCKHKTMEDGKIKVKMTKLAKIFWEGPVWEEWEKYYPDLKLFLESYLRDKVMIDLVQTYRFAG